MSFLDNVVASEGNNGLGRNGMSDDNLGKTREDLLERIGGEQWSERIKPSASRLKPKTQFVSFISGFINMLQKSFKVPKSTDLSDLNDVVDKKFITKKELHMILTSFIATKQTAETAIEWANDSRGVSKMKCLQLLAATVELLPTDIHIWLQREFVCQQ